MYESGINCEESVHYNLLFCHACLSSNRTLSSVGDYVDIYLKICDNPRMNLTSQVNLCWECMALLKKVHAFMRKVENAQKILDYCINKQVPLEDSLSDLTLSSTETTTFDYYPILQNEDADEYENYPEKGKISVDYMDKSDVKMAEDFYELKGELMFKIEDVRGRCDILDVKPILDLSTSSCDTSVKLEPGSPEDSEEGRRRRWKRSVLHVFKRICSHRYAHHFLRPVSDDLAPLYSRIVRRPTDLSTIRRRIKDDVIRTTAELTRALLLMFSNALMYNSTCHKIYQMTQEFRDETLRELSLLTAAQAQMDRPPAPELRRRPVSPPTAAPVTPALTAATVTPATPAAPPRRSAPASTPRAPQPLARRRASVWDASQEDQIKTAVTPRPPRRGSVSPEPTAEHPPSKRRTKWDWPGQDNDQYLVANCFKKYKSTVL